MTARDLDELRQEETAYERKCQIISEIAAHIDGKSNQAAYREQIDLLFAALETSVRDLESGGGLDDACAKEIVERVSELKREQEKYQVWLLGEAADCAPVEKLLDVSQVHLLGTVKQISDGQKESDYIIVCSQYENIAGMHWFGQVRLLRFDLFRLMNEISPEATYQQIKNKKEVTTAAAMSRRASAMRDWHGISCVWRDRRRICTRIITAFCGHMTKSRTDKNAGWSIASSE